MLSSARKIVLHPARRDLLRVVATFEFSKGILVLLIGLSALLLVHKDAWVIAESLLALLHINTDRHSAQLFLDFADRLTDSRLWTAAQVAFTYSILRFAEAYGLWKERTWAEWLAFVSGTLLLPFEIRGLMRGITVMRLAVFLGNLVIVFYMLYILRSGGLLRRGSSASDIGISGGSGK
jgi:uncharacterized membrane protein (DUF2068 family)